MMMMMMMRVYFFLTFHDFVLGQKREFLSYFGGTSTTSHQISTEILVQTKMSVFVKIEWAFLVECASRKLSVKSQCNLTLFKETKFSLSGINRENSGTIRGMDKFDF